MDLIADEDFREDFTAVCKEIEDTVNAANACLIPKKSKERYEKQFRVFSEWRKEKGIKGVNENLIMSFIYEKSLKYKPSSLWAFMSMLKSTLLVYENVDIGKFTKVTSFLKKKSLGYQPKKSRNLSRQDIDRFLTEAPNDRYLMIKVATVFGVNGGCRREELYKMRVNDIKDKGEYIVIEIPDSKTHVPRKFTIVADGEGLNCLELYRQYASLRPCHVDHNRFFISYRHGKCTVQPVGIKSFGKFPSVIASFLGLENPESYTGHCFRRSSATILADAGADVLTLKRHGSWKSSSVAESYMAESVTNKIKIAKMIQGDRTVKSASASETLDIHNSNNYNDQLQSTSHLTVPGATFNFHPESKCTVNFYSCKH